MTKDKDLINKLEIEEIKENFKNYSEDIQIRLVKEKDTSLANLMNEETFMKLISPSHPVPSKEQISDNGIFIKYLDNPSEDFKLKAIEVNPYVILHMGLPSSEAIKLALKDIRFQDAKILMKIIGEQPEDMLKEMINSRGCVIEILDKPNYDLRLEALRVNGLLIRHEENPTLEMKKVALNNNGLALEFIKDKTKELSLIAIGNNPKAIKFIENQSKDLILKAVRKDGLTLSFIKNKDEEIIIEALRSNPEAIKYIDFYSSAIKKEAEKYEFSKEYLKKKCL